MNWASLDPGILAHFQAVGTFRKNHAAVGAGASPEAGCASNVYAFSRTLKSGNVDDAVVVAITPTN
jgi:alpha-amylase